MNAYYPVERFLESIENASREDALFSNKGGVLSATVHTGRTIEAFGMFEKAILKSLTGTNIFYMNNLQ